MADIRVGISVEDQFSQRLDAFEKRLRALEGNAGKLDKKDRDVSKSMESMGKSADKAGGMFKGLGATMMIANQAMQAMQRVAQALTGALNDVAEKQRAVIMLGKEAGEELSEFAKESARLTGRSQGDIMRTAMQWRRTGVGGQEIMDLTKMADRFANLNGREYTEVANVLNDAIKSHSASGLADLLGGGEGVERRLQRAGVERALRRGDVQTAMQKFSSVADTFGFTQEQADKMGNTVDRQVERITNRVKDKFTNLFAGIVERAAPYINKFLDWLDGEDVTMFLNLVGNGITSVINLVGELVDAVGNAWDELFGYMHDKWDEQVGETTSTVEMLVGVFVGGFSEIGAMIANVFIGAWRGIMKMSQGIIRVGYYIYDGFRWCVHKIKTGVASMISFVVGGIASMGQKLSGSWLGDKILSEQSKMSIEGTRQYAEHMKQIAGEEFVASNPSEYQKYFDEWMPEYYDADQVAADNIQAVMDWIGKAEADTNKQMRERERKEWKELKGIHSDTGKIRGAMTHEEDLRWLKERAEQHAINNVNVRQLTPTINVRIEGTNVGMNDIRRTLKKVLEEEVNAGTFNAYGEVA